MNINQIKRRLCCFFLSVFFSFFSFYINNKHNRYNLYNVSFNIESIIIIQYITNLFTRVNAFVAPMKYYVLYYPRDYVYIINAICSFFLFLFVVFLAVVIENNIHVLLREDMWSIRNTSVTVRSRRETDLLFISCVRRNMDTSSLSRNCYRCYDLRRGHIIRVHTYLFVYPYTFWFRVGQYVLFVSFYHSNSTIHHFYELKLFNHWSLRLHLFIYFFLFPLYDYLNYMHCNLSEIFTGSICSPVV